MDTLTTVRKQERALKYTLRRKYLHLDSKGELLITIIQSYRKKAVSISENVTWGQRKRLQTVKLTCPTETFLDIKGDNGSKLLKAKQNCENDL